MTKTFRELGVAEPLCAALESQGIVTAFPIQELTLPLALAGHDLIGQARTGTGKTLAFGLPLLQRLNPNLAATQALVIVPTRELCLQVYNDLTIGRELGLTSIAVYGGVGYDEQTDALTGGAHVVVGTPGRLLDLMDRKVLDLSHVTQLVLDEADEMLDMGFLPDVERLIEACPSDSRHTMLFSATMPTQIIKLGRRYMQHPTFTRADHEEVGTAPTVEQFFFQVHRMDKPRILARILQSAGRQAVYVFVRTKHMADRLVDELAELNTPAIAIHGDLRQSTRERNLERFRSGQANVLVATEVAARGLDIDNVTHVVNYDCPDDDKMYLHRIGRTARAGRDGVAVTFAEHHEAERLNVIRKAVGAEREVAAVFSTSPELDEWFDLPAATPWSGFADNAKDRGDSRRKPSRDTGTSSNRQRETDKSSSKQHETSTSSDKQREAGRPSDKQRNGRSSATKSKASTPPTKPDDKAEPSDKNSTRTRTRTRSRGDAATTQPSQRSGAVERTSPPDNQDGSTASPRTRARAGRTGQPRSSQSSSDSSTRQASNGRASGRLERNEEGRQADRGTGGRQRSRNQGERNGSERSGNQRNQRARDDRDRARSGGNGRTSRAGSSGGGNDRSASGGADPARNVQPRGTQARGQGQPQVARTVKVEHLP